MPELHLLRDLLILFGLGVVVVVAFHRANLPPIVGFLITGVLCGPYGFGLIDGPRDVEALAEIGVVLLLFTVGIEFSMAELIRLRTFLLIGGGLQVTLTVLLTALAARVLELPWTVAVFLGMLVSLSSTAIVIRLLADRGEIDSPHGRAALGILIFQDLCVVPMVLLTPFLGGDGTTPGAIGWVMLKAALFMATAVVAARYVVPWILHQVVGTRKRETFLLTIILLCLGTAWASAEAGLSLALGAFIAGLIISESEYSHQALGEMLPLREVFNSLFFVSIGMLFDIRTILADPLVVVAAIVVVVLTKALVTTGVAVALGHSLRVAIVSGFAIAQIGEFSFVLSKVGLAAGLLDARLNQLFLAVAVGTLAMTPALHWFSPRLAGALERRVRGHWASGRAMATIPRGTLPPLDDHVIIVGYGVNGRNLARVLARVDIPFVVVEMNPDAVRAERKRGRPIIYGDATRREILEYAGLDNARVLVIAISDAAATRSAVDTARRLNPRVHIVVRSRYVQEMEPLFALGTNEVVPEEFETSIEIFSRVLQRFLVPRDVIERCIRDVRRDGYEMFRTIADQHRESGVLDRFLGNVSLEVYRAERGSSLVGKSLGSSGIRQHSGATVVAIQRQGTAVVANPTGSDVIQEGDAVLVLGRPEQLAEAAPLFRCQDLR